MRDRHAVATPTEFRPPLDDAAVEEQLRLHERINRATRWIAGIGASLLLGYYLHVVPIPLRPFVRPVVVFAVTLLFGLEAWRWLGQGRLPGRLRWTRLTIGACMGALAIGEAVRHIRPTVDPTSEGKLGIAVIALAIALVCDLREFSDRSRYGKQARVGMILGAVGTALMGATLLGESMMPFELWWRLFLGSSILIAIAGGIYLRVRSPLSSRPAPDRASR